MDFNPRDFVKRKVREISDVIGEERALIAVSGGVDSTTCAVLTHHAMNGNLICVILDDAFMRVGEPERVAFLLSKHPLNLPVKILSVQKKFLSALKGLRDAEKKRKAFREAFYVTLAKSAKEESCSFLIQGTIRADVIETVGGVKTQHNVLSQIGLSPFERYGFQVIEPLVELYKSEVRQVARYLGIPPEIAERQPFPGPGLSVRVVGEIKIDKLETLRKATDIAEKELAKHQPDQYFTAIINNEERSPHQRLEFIQKLTASILKVPQETVSVRVLRSKATGVREGKRRYGYICTLEVKIAENRFHKPSHRELLSLQEKIIAKNPAITRVLYAVQDTSLDEPYIITIRAIQTEDFIKADVAPLPWTTLDETADKIIEVCPNVSSVHYDITPKPPATIEME